MPESSFKKTASTILVIAILLAAAWWVGRVFFSNQDAVRAFFARFPFGLAAALLVVLYVASSFIIFDVKDILKIVSALLFGAWWSTLLIWIAELINNTMLFHLARRLGRSWIERKFGLHGNDVGWVQKLCGVWQIFILRTIPVVPYRVLDLAYGLTAVQFRRYFIVSAVASPVRIFWLQSVLTALGGAVFQPEKIKDYYTAHPEALRFGAVYIVISIIAGFVLSRKFK